MAIVRLTTTRHSPTMRSSSVTRSKPPSGENEAQPARNRAAAAVAVRRIICGLRDPDGLPAPEAQQREPDWELPAAALVGEQLQDQREQPGQLRGRHDRHP